MDDLERLLADEEKETPSSPAEGTQVPENKEEKPNPEVLRKQEELENLNKALVEAQVELRRVRDEKKKVKLSSQEIEEDELPKINMEDPSAKAWDKHIRQSVSPLQAEQDQEKEEIRSYALREFLSDKPALAKSPEKLKELIAEYEALSKGKISEKTKEGVSLYLDKAYASVFHQELLKSARSQSVERAQADILFSDIAVSKGATAYSSPKETSAIKLTEEERDIVSKWDKSLATLDIK